MDRKYGKKILILDILKILQEHTDSEHGISQNTIKEILEKDYKLKVDRKTIKRNIENLIEYGERNDAKEILYETTSRKNKNQSSGKEKDIDVVTNFAYVHDFTHGELRLIIDSILFSRHIATSQKEELIKKLEDLSSKYFNSRLNHIRIMGNDEPKNQDIFYNIEILDEAISKSKQVAFNYCRYVLDKNSSISLQPQVSEDGSVREYIVNPYHIVASNGRYYLICNYNRFDNLSHYRLDRIKNIRILDEIRKPMEKIKGLEYGLNLQKHMAEHIYMYGGPSITAGIRFKKEILSEFVDWFGTEDLRFSDESKDEITVWVSVNKVAMKKWALQYGLHVKVIAPKTLVDEIREDIDKVSNKYK